MRLHSFILVSLLSTVILCLLLSSSQRTSNNFQRKPVARECIEDKCSPIHASCFENPSRGNQTCSGSFSECSIDCLKTTENWPACNKACFDHHSLCYEQGKNITDFNIASSSEVRTLCDEGYSRCLTYCFNSTASSGINIQRSLRYFKQTSARFCDTYGRGQRLIGCAEFSRDPWSNGNCNALYGRLIQRCQNLNDNVNEIHQWMIEGFGYQIKVKLANRLLCQRECRRRGTAECPSKFDEVYIKYDNVCVVMTQACLDLCKEQFLLPDDNVNVMNSLSIFGERNYNCLLACQKKHYDNLEKYIQNHANLIRYNLTTREMAVDDFYNREAKGEFSTCTLECNNIIGRFHYKQSTTKGISSVLKPN